MTTLLEKKFTTTIVDEQDLTWQQHNKIHRALNRAFAHRTRSFIKKTYAHEEPIKRILIEQDDEIVGHTAIFNTAIIIDDQQINVAGIGMSLSLRPFHKLGFILRQQAVTLCKQLNYPMVVGRIKYSEKALAELAPLLTAYLDMPLIGKTTISHAWEVLTIYDTSINTPLAKQLIAHFKEKTHIRLNTEIF